MARPRFNIHYKLVNLISVILIAMQPQENISLKGYSTMRLGGMAKYLQQINNINDIETALNRAESNKIANVIMIGAGSNIIWQDSGYDGLVLVNNIKGVEFQEQGDGSFLTIGAGEVWDDIVEQTTNKNLSGIEQLSLIPGLAGATPVQNVGAYGREIKDVLVCVQAYDKLEKKMVTIPKIDCDLDYRTSRFKTKVKGRFFITSVTLTLSNKPPMPPFYSAVQNYLNEHEIKQYTPTAIRQAVIDIRSNKLPDPREVANCGSFFTNPFIPRMQLEELKEQYPGIVYWDVSDDTVKISAAWMMEALGLKGYHEPTTGMAVWEKQPLVLVNERASSTASLIAFRDAILQAAKKKFDVDLVQEPEII